MILYFIFKRKFVAAFICFFIKNVTSNRVLKNNNKFTFINKNSSAIFINTNWNENNEAFYFRLSSSGKDGNVLSVYDKLSAQRLQIKISNGKFNIIVEDQHYNIPGLTDFVIKIRRWYIIKLFQLNTALKLELNNQTVLIANKKKKIFSKWESIHFGTNVVEDIFQGNSFIGCIDIPQSESLLFKVSNLIQEGCVNACLIQSCYNGGRCINYYDHVVCDCFGTGFKGIACETEHPTIYFDGKSYVTFKGNKNLEGEIKILTQFKTMSEGVILATNFEKSIIIIEVYNGNVYCRGNAAGGSVSVKVGNFVLDEQWHYLSLVKHPQYIKIKLDRQIFTLLSIQNQDEIQFNKEQEYFYIGGVGNPQNMTHSLSKKYFKGCLKHNIFNSHDKNVKTVWSDLGYQLFDNVTQC
ncbi:neurexin-1a [Hydra vulgaris]|uniref:neurexin-1a n=1 Tax=Hydra vulgaris TaxID=6087 RepID=UPI001F5EC16D|nr:neurexin-1a-like isoform X1 [Hydra vulgaris]